jgi:crotonobetainyl-CoA:carnitine CoA-transferase CaiB-like acyl-CoA transferase
VRERAGPLAGTRVIELGVWVAGPGAGGVLADWGADVIKVEAPSGDPFRNLFRAVAGQDIASSPPFDFDNRGKRSVVLDLRDPDHGAAMLELLATADVFLTNLHPDAVERLGLAPAAVLAANERIVYASVSGYGLEGPDSHRPGYDLGSFWARSGLADHFTPNGRDPNDIRGGFGDHVTAMIAVAGITAALLERTRTGRGQLVETSLLRAGIWCLGWDLGIQLRFGKAAPTLPRAEAVNAMLNSYRAGDGRWFWLLGLEADRHWPAVLESIGRPELADDERFADARGRRKNAVALVALLDAEFAAAPAATWYERFDAAGVWWAPVQRLDEVVEDPQAIVAGAFVDVPGGDGAEAHRAVASPVTFGRAAPEVAGPVPALGEHTVEVLTELGVTLGA